LRKTKIVSKRDALVQNSERYPTKKGKEGTFLGTKDSINTKKPKGIDKMGGEGTVILKKK